jgi:hypothetical protein
VCPPRNRGRVGCGCLVFLLGIILVAIGLLAHPVSLRFAARQLRYEDKIFPSDALFVPRFAEDRQGETYIAAFKELKSGNGKLILIEDDTFLGAGILEPVQKMAKNHGVGSDLVKSIRAGEEAPGSSRKPGDPFSDRQVRKVIVVVPEYASRVYHAALGARENDGGTIFLVRPVKVSYFNGESWWKDALSRNLVLREYSALGGVYIDRFTFGDKKK